MRSHDTGGAGRGSRLETRPRASRICPARFSPASAPHSHNVPSQAGSGGPVRSADERARNPVVCGRVPQHYCCLGWIKAKAHRRCPVPRRMSGNPRALPAGCQDLLPLRCDSRDYLQRLPNVPWGQGGGAKSLPAEHHRCCVRELWADSQRLGQDHSFRPGSSFSRLSGQAVAQAP